MSGSYECLDNESNESEFVRNQDRSCLRIRLSRVFSSGSLKSPKSPGYSTLSDSPKSPGRSPLSRTCYSWQSFNSEDQLPKSSISPTCNVDSTLEKNIESSKNNVENRMKYSPQQQQKERKSESDVASVIATPSRTSRSRNSTHGCSSNRIINNTISTGIFAWMRVFRMASLLHQIGC